MSASRLLPGLVFAVIGAIMAGIAATYPLGMLLRPGPGFFPLAIGLILAAFGVASAIEDARTAPGDMADEDGFGWRPLVTTTAGILAFAWLLETLGFVPAAIALVYLSAMGERRSDWLAVTLMAAGLAFFGTALFIWGLGLPIRPFGAS